MWADIAYLGANDIISMKERATTKYLQIEIIFPAATNLICVTNSAVPGRVPQVQAFNTHIFCLIMDREEVILKEKTKLFVWFGQQFSELIYFSYMNMFTLPGKCYIIINWIK